MLYLITLHKKYLQNFTRYKTGVQFSLNFGWYSIQIAIVCLRTEGRTVFTQLTKSVKCGKSYLLTLPLTCFTITVKNLPLHHSLY